MNNGHQDRVEHAPGSRMGVETANASSADDRHIQHSSIRQEVILWLTQKWHQQCSDQAR